MKKFFLIGIGGMVVSAAAFGLSQTNNNLFVHSNEAGQNSANKESLAPKEVMKRMETPKVVRAVYLTAPSGGREDKIQAIINMKKDGLNAVVIDIKDSFGVVAYDTQLDMVNRYELERKFIPDLAALVQRFHDEGIYVIARVAVFQDTAFAEARPELAVHDKRKLNAAGGVMSKKTLWRDGKNLAWVDPSSREVWEYVVALSNDALSYGFDELNYDYIRFPSDGKISTIAYSVTKPDASYPVQIRGFMQYLREQLRDTVLSVDLFGFTMVKSEDIGIGQIVEDAYAYFDYVAPMVYPSHYPSGFMGYKNPAAWPYEIIADSMQKGQARLDAYQATASTTAKLRPWLQDFDLGADYDAAMIGKQIQATEDMLGEQYAGYMLWNPSSNYTVSGIR
ncbi:hypothetical protein A2372_03890 [Candidatus Wolfebacteria bacterium RIFOXYB1_FULL_54_12]|uniref:DUF4015 domain-containing protein n=1 Tax=Candidatus Wolfebacteria bacterium RIFOXYB1_FULL_54_12 TaxID=1802559 RepID=A0A1F8DWM6_9BACT|nr:MAG: hypothetical protein A2372_03890 [Candidatus Wolfebacteria bacterium RIFOXYB1_FULL_54_12]